MDAVEAVIFIVWLGFFGLGVVNLIQMVIPGILGWLWARRQVARLLAAGYIPMGSAWDLPDDLPAPEAYTLMYGPNGTGKDAFKLGLLQLLATGVLEAPKLTLDGKEETYLVRGQPEFPQLTGSSASIYRVWSAAPGRPVREFVSAVKEEYGSLEAFGKKEVLPELVARGLYAEQDHHVLGVFPVTRFVLTVEGQAARDALETRMAEALRQMRDCGAPWRTKGPRRALLAAVLAAATGQRTSVEGTGVWVAERELEEAAVEGQPAIAGNTGGEWTGGEGTAGGRLESSGISDAWLNWTILDGLDGVFADVDSCIDACDGGGLDGGDGGDGGGGE